MKTRNGKSVLGLSLVTAMLLGSSAYAGKIVTDADLSNIVVTEDKQFGFLGWNLENIDVRIVNVADFAGSVGTFYSDGTYTSMGPDMSFESDITTGGEIRGHLHGKDWPVGEPSGIKIINDDMNVKEPKPKNCIMTSSYLEDGYLDSIDPKPVLCSSDWQTHKRFKINLLPTTVAELDAEGYGKPVDLVFNLDMDDTNTTIRQYQVLQKINNYTDKRLDGYKVEVLDEKGNSNNAALTLSLGESDNIWTEDEMANFSHGLWGPYQEVKDVVRFENAFFDYKRAYYPVTLVDNIISYKGNMLGGNYQEIFGNWLPSIWAPMGIFYDEDNNPETDGKLKAFYGIAPGETVIAWWKSTIVDVDPDDKIDPVYTWSEVRDNDLGDWEGELYDQESIEDVLNLGLNYIVSVGENALIGETFTLRITPHVAADQTPPSYYVPPVDPTDPTDPEAGPTPPAEIPPYYFPSSGGGCTYNPNSKNFDMTFLLMMALGALYPFRRRFLK